MPASVAGWPSTPVTSSTCTGPSMNDELAELDLAVVVLAVVLLERLDGVRRGRRPVVVDRHVVLLGVAQRRQQVLHLEHVLAVLDAGPERPPQRERAVARR